MEPGSVRPPLHRDEWLTQLGPKFYDHPKPGQNDVSLFVGRLSVDDMLRIVGGPGRIRKKRDAVRWTRVGCLQDAGFRLTEDDELVNGGRHIRVQVHGQWTDDHSTRFNACFVGEGPEEGL